MENGGGALNSFVSHVFYYLEWLLEPIRRLKAYLTPDDTERPTGANDGANLWLELNSGASVSVAVNCGAFLGTGHRVEIYGDQGSLVLENPTSDYVAGFRLLHGTRENKSLATISESGNVSQLDGRVVMVGRMVKRFVDWAQDGIPAIPTVEHGYRVQTLLDAALESHAKKVWVDVLHCAVDRESAASGEK